MTSCLTRCPVYSVVIYLVDDGEIVEPPYRQETAGELVHVFYFHNIKLWKVPAMMLMQAGLEGMLPLLPLAEGGQRREIVEAAITRLKATGHEDLLALSYGFAGLVFTTEADKLWLKERFEQMHDILEGSWSYQEMVQKGLLQGLEQGRAEGRQQEQARQLDTLRRVLVRLVQKHFPALTSLARQQSLLIEDVELLQKTIDAIIDAETVEDAKCALDAVFLSE